MFMLVRPWRIAKRVQITYLPCPWHLSGLSAHCCFSWALRFVFCISKSESIDRDELPNFDDQFACTRLKFVLSVKAEREMRDWRSDSIKKKKKECARERRWLMMHVAHLCKITENEVHHFTKYLQGRWQGSDNEESPSSVKKFFHLEEITPEFICGNNTRDLMICAAEWMRQILYPGMSTNPYVFHVWVSSVNEPCCLLKCKNAVIANDSEFQCFARNNHEARVWHALRCQKIQYSKEYFAVFSYSQSSVQHAYTSHHNNSPSMAIFGSMSMFVRTRVESLLR